MDDSITPSAVHQPQSGSTYNSGSATVSINTQPTITESTVQIQSYTCWSVLNIFCCCLCLGCVACYYSNQTKDLKRMGNIQGALNYSRKARQTNIIATILGVIIIFINILVLIMQSSSKSLI